MSTEHCESCDPSFSCWAKPQDCRKPDKGGSSPSSCSVVPTSRSVIEGKLLDALSNDGCVAILASEDDLNVMIAALEYAMLGNHKQTVAARALAKDMRQLRKEAFPPNHRGQPRGVAPLAVATG